MNPLAFLEAIAFAQPWILWALLLLPVIWILLRLTPPSPKRLPFPAFALIFGLAAKEETPARTPWWLILLRLTALALIILGLAQPLLHSRNRAIEGGDLILVIDDGWAAANHWQDRIARAESILTQAARNNQSVALLTTAPDSRDSPPDVKGLMRAEQALALVKGLLPKAWPVDHGGALDALKALERGGEAAVKTARAVWLSDGLGQAESGDLAKALRRYGRVSLYLDAPQRSALVINPPENDGEGMTVTLSRAYAHAPLGVAILAVGESGNTLARAEGLFDQGRQTTDLRLELPSEIRNRIARLVIAGRSDAGSTFLIDERWRRRPVGLVTGDTTDFDQPLLSEIYYIDRALAPFSELRKGPVEKLLARDLAVLILPDSTPLSRTELRQVESWVKDGGLLIRFAGPRLAELGLSGQSLAPEAEGLLPVRLRRGGRILDGALSWDEALSLASFEATNLFSGLEVPADVQVRRQVLAEPSLELPERTLARLEDGTPLVTHAASGSGQIVLFHVGANSEWSNLPLSGLFVEMLRRLVGMSRGLVTEGQLAESLPPRQIMDGFGVLGPPSASVVALEAGQIGEEAPGPKHPPGFYGSDSGQVAFNLGGNIAAFSPLPALPSGVDREFYKGGAKREVDLKPWLLAAAILLLLADLLIALILRGHMRLTRASALGVLVLGLALGAPFWTTPAYAQDSFGAMSYSGPDARILDATLVTRLAYVLTDNPRIDEKSNAGLMGLSRILTNRSSIEAGPPVAVDPELDELIFYPLIYWPLTAEDPGLSQKAAKRVNAYLRSGGTIFFDLQDPTASTRLPGQGGRRDQVLAELALQLDIPPLDPVPPDHVLTKSFYLIQDFPGRYAGAPLWIETGERRNIDGVATVLVGSNDWAAAWAIDELGRPLFPVVPGGERQREMAFRFGVNLAMYAMTGNYKADQVHIPFILERLGQ